MTCFYCKGDVETSTTTYMTDYQGCYIIIKNVPCEKCSQQHNKEQQEYLDKIGLEISRMKEGSVALVNQITTISKIRIFDPRNLKGVLAGISLSEENMEKINEKMKSLYIFGK